MNPDDKELPELPDMSKIIEFLKQTEPQLLEDIYKIEHDVTALNNFKAWVQKTISNVDMEFFANEPNEPYTETVIHKLKSPGVKYNGIVSGIKFLNITKKYTPEELSEFFNESDEESDEESDDFDELEDTAADDEARVAASYYELPAAIRDQITPELINILYALASHVPEWFDSYELDALINWLTDIYEYHQLIQGSE